MPTSPRFWTRFPAHLAVNKKVILPEQQNKNLAQKTRWSIDDPKFRHRAVMGLFGDIDSQSPRSELSILYRFETLPGQAPYFLVQSTQAPVHHLNLDGVQVRKVDITAPAEGTEVEFRITVNAVARRSVEIPDGSKENTKRKEVIRPLSMDPLPDGSGDSEVSAWLKAKLSPALDNMTITRHGRQVLGANRRGAHKNTRVVQADMFDGVATVKDSDALHTLLLNGLGRAKSYGCGLLTIRPLG
ncbi:type I-E CRISPR-associated protein Cas6/Cse3/CasE [Corynebacterium sp. 3HC-13]|uniref:type I-E CRISPR-associated protein Cas6/Cse3/CasE n=1 Tax=Corynebacterium poyangense TaxID=2684405 RepID=UPI001CCFC754|nr:type I-E CRISPR-associated protein Cas6/Cse3/CasE [Corynebacterium poyangense]MBZ8178368.1 type I-E CRISPR-associated protein Cas6/Cse3/CasE [Corynebacterium poyangense]